MNYPRTKNIRLYWLLGKILQFVNYIYFSLFFKFLIFFKILFFMIDILFIIDYIHDRTIYYSNCKKFSTSYSTKSVYWSFRTNFEIISKYLTKKKKKKKKKKKNSHTNLFYLILFFFIS